MHRLGLTQNNKTYEGNDEHESRPLGHEPTPPGEEPLEEVESPRSTATSSDTFHNYKLFKIN